VCGKFGLILSLVGVAALIGSETILVEPEWASAVSGQLGWLLIAIGLLGLGWEKMGKRELAEEVLEKAGLGERVRTSGLCYVGRPYADSEQWSSWLAAGTT
jgi:hypothetical protein